MSERWEHHFRLHLRNGCILPAGVDVPERPLEDVIPDLVNEMLARSGEDDVWLGRTAALGCVIEGTVQAYAAEAAQNN